MSRQIPRLLELIEYVQQTAQLGSKVVSNIKDAYQPNLWLEDQLMNLPGIHLNQLDAESGAEVWLEVQRLRETTAPLPDNELLRLWLLRSNDTAHQPGLRTSVAVGELRSLVDKFTIPASLASNVQLLLADFEAQVQVRQAYTLYLEKKWLPWAHEEAKRRKTINIYSRLFALQQQLEMGSGEKPLELLWGIGIALVHRPKRGIEICHPLLLRGVELTVNTSTMAMQVRPLEAATRVELRCFGEDEFPGVLDVEKAGKNIYSSETDGLDLSPFERVSFEPLLQIAATHLDARGIYLPDQISATNRLLPTSGEDLRVTDTWVLFARPRGVGLLTQDLERFKQRLIADSDIQLLPHAVAALVTEPAQVQGAAEVLPSYRGLSLVGTQPPVGSGYRQGRESIRELYFPMPFNDEQVQIIQRLDRHNGVVVQGPPGTGKTHTIANIICHYLALGRRVLVTSLKDQALAVVQEKLPPEIRKLSVSLLTSEAEGMKQFSNAITALAAGIQSTNRDTAAQEIVKSAEDLDSLHATIAQIDRELADWAARNTEPIVVHGETLLPLAAAEEVSAGEGQYEWFPDDLTIHTVHEPRFTEEKISALRQARQSLGADLSYLGARLPRPSDLPDAQRVAQLHHQLTQLQQLVDAEETGLPGWGLQVLGDEEALRTLLMVLLDLQEEQARLLAGPDWVTTWLAGAGVNDSEYQTVVQPLPTALPTAQHIGELHRQLIQYHQLGAVIEAGDLPALARQVEGKSGELQAMLDELVELQTQQRRLLDDLGWERALLSRYRSKEQSTEFDLLDELGEDLAGAQAQNEVFLRRPVAGVEDFRPGSELLVALDNLAAGQPPFGLMGLFGKKTEKVQLAAVRILISPPATSQDWSHVRAYVAFLQSVQELALRWTILAPRLGLPTADNLSALKAAYGRYDAVVAYVEQEYQVRTRLRTVLPGWLSNDPLDNGDSVAEAIRVLQMHLTRLGFGTALTSRDAALTALLGTDGSISRSLHRLLTDHVGSANVSESDLVATWTNLLAELQRAQTLEATHTTRELAARNRLQAALPLWSGNTPLSSPSQILEAIRVVRRHLLAASWSARDAVLAALREKDGPITNAQHQFIAKELGTPALSESDAHSRWAELLAELQRVRALRSDLETVNDVTRSISDSGAPDWATWLRTFSRKKEAQEDELLPTSWQKAWRLKRLANFVDSIDARASVRQLSRRRGEATADLARTYQKLIAARTWLRLAENATPAVRSALQAFLTAMGRIGKTGKGKKAHAARGDARRAAELAQPAIPCWILPHYRVSEALPSEFGSFDLVIIDEASQSDLSALPALLRAKKLLIVGDDKQVSPAAVGMNVDEVQKLMQRMLPEAVEVFKPLFSPDRSIYDLCKVVYADTALMLREHFRSVASIIEYSKRQYYDHELRPLRYPKASERLDPPLVDVLITDGFRKGDINPGEARFIVDEIRTITQDPAMAKRSIGVISLTGNTQAYHIWEMLQKTLAPEVILRHRIACGDAPTFQGNERDIIFLSMLVSKGDAHPASGTGYEQRFNVAASRARDRMYLVRSMELDELSLKDLRRSLVEHFQAPFRQEEAGLVADRRSLCESGFERDVFDELITRGYRVIPQVRVGSYRIDMVVEGANDERLAIECDGDRYHGPAQWEADMRRQRVLERAGWQFWRCFASTFVRYREDVLKDLVKQLQARGINPISAEAISVESAFVETRRVRSFEPIHPQNGQVMLTL